MLLHFRHFRHPWRSDAVSDRNRSTATVRTDFVSFSRRFSILDIRSRFQSPFLGLLLTISPAHAETYQPLSSIQDAAQAFVLQHAPGGRVEVDASSVDPRLKLPACTGALQAFLPPGGRIGSSTSVGIRCQKPKSWSLYVPVRVKVFTPVITASHALLPGSRISPGDFQTIEMDVANLPAGYLSNPEQVLNKILKRPLGMGAVFSPEAVSAAPLIRRGDQVTLLAETQGMQIRASGKALKDGAEGAVIQVRNLSSQRIIEGVVLSAGIVKIIM